MGKSGIDFFRRNRKRDPVPFFYWLLLLCFLSSRYLAAFAFTGSVFQSRRPGELVPKLGLLSSPEPYREVRLPSRLQPSFQVPSGRGDDPQDNLEDSNQGNGNTPPRDKFKDWFGKETNMVRPVLQDGTFMDEDDETGSARVKASMGNLFQDMPLMSQILSDDSTETESPSNAAQQESVKEKRRKRAVDYSWFDPIRKEIEAKYVEIREEMLQQLEELRREDPESVPPNAESIMESVWKQEMEEEIKSVREETAKEILAVYEKEERNFVDSRDVTGVQDDTVQKLIEEFQAEEAKRAAFQAEVDKYKIYEKEASRRAMDMQLKLPSEGEDLDQWALKRLQEMASAQAENEDASVLDIVEENLVELQQKLDKENRREGSVRPETAKEWQMYRSIATRLARDQSNASGNTETAEYEEDKDAIAIQLQSWKRFQEKQEAVRKQSGLARGPRLPFEWQEAGLDSRADAEPSTEVQRKRSQAEISKEVNQLALQAVQDLIEKRKGTRRGERLTALLEDLRSGLESETYNEEEIEQDEGTIGGPVDVSDIFSSQSLESVSSMPKGQPGETVGGDETESSRPQPPETPFFTTQEVDSYDSRTRPPPPDTAFFSSDESEIEYEELDTSKLGTIEEQKLRTMYRKAGATSDEEKEKIRAQWAEFKKIEKQKRDQSGLSERETDESLKESGLGYDVSDVLTEDGDIDAEKILSKIGPRPTRTKPKAASTASAQDSPPIAKEDAFSGTASTVSKEEIVEDMYRAVSAVGGGRTKDDPEAKAKEMAAFENFVKKQEDVREFLDEVDTGMTNGTLIPINDPKTDEEGMEYAQSVLQSMNPRPVREQRKRPDEYEREISDGNIVPEDLDFEEPGLLLEEQSSSPDRQDRSLGGGFLGSEVDDSFTLQGDEVFERNRRQLAEYEQRRASRRPKQMGIDISDVLGRRSDDYEYQYSDYYSGRRVSESGFSSFAARKANLLEYEELNVMELNSLMDHKDSVQSTGVSQYMPRINKPFKEFGAIFRLEGVLLDITGLQHQAWTRVAGKYGFVVPSVGDSRRASVTPSEFAVRKIFCWTDSVPLIREVARTHLAALNEVFYEWMIQNNLSYPLEKTVTEASVVGQPESSSQQEGKRASVVLGDSDAALEFQLAAWVKAAKQFGYPLPTLDQAVFASVISPDDAVRQAFGWTTDATAVSEAVSVYKRALLQSAGKESETYTMLGTNGSGPDVSSITTNTGQNTIQQAGLGGAGEANQKLGENDMLQIQYTAWMTLAEEHGFEPPTPDEALGAMVINDPALIVRDGFAWTDDPEVVDDLVESYLSLVENLVHEATGESKQRVSLDIAIDAERAAQISHADPAQGPSKQELLEMHGYAWTVAAEKHGLGSVPVDEIHVAMHLKPEEAMRLLYGWIDDEKTIREVSATFASELKSIFRQYMQENNLKEEEVVVEKKGNPTALAPDIDEGPTSGELFQVARNAWNRVAHEGGFPEPSDDLVQFSMTVGPEDALPAFQWSKDPVIKQEIVDAYKECLRQSASEWQNRRKNASPEKPSTTSSETAPPPVLLVPGTTKWLQSLVDVEMQCGVVSHLDRKQMDVLLDYSGFSQYFPSDKRVSASCGYDNRESQQLLGAALRLERRPDHCVLFDTTPQASAAAHDAEMKSVSMIGVYPMYELLNADSTARYCDELTAMNIRRLFGERIYDQPMFETWREQPGPSSQTKRTRFWEEGDRS